MISRAHAASAPLLLLLGAAMLNGKPARGDEIDDLAGALAQPIVSTASQTAETTGDAPATSTVISASDLKRWGFRTVDQAIRYLAVGMFTNDTVHFSDVGARGVALRLDRNVHVLVLIDGHTVNDGVGGTQALDHGLGMPIELVDRIEVVLGPGSVLYGPNAMFGVIHVFTRDGRTFKGAHAAADSEIGTGYRAMLGYGGAYSVAGVSARVTAAIEAHTRHQPLEFREQLIPTLPGTPPRRYRQDGPQDNIWGGGTWDNNRAQGAGGRARVEAGEFALGLRGGFHTRSNPTMQPDFDGDHHEDDRWIDVDLAWRRAITSRLDLGLRLYGDHRHMLRHTESSSSANCYDGQDAGCKVDITTGSEWFGAEPQLVADWRRDRSHVTLIGVDGRLYQARFRVASADWQPLGPARRSADFSGYEPTLGVYAAHTARFFSRLTVNAGARFDADERRGALSPRLAISARLWTGATVKIMGAAGFRPPTLTERYMASPAFFVRAGRLDNETTRALELSFEQTFRGLRAFAAGYLQRWDDLISAQILSQTEIADARNRGELNPSVGFIAAMYRNGGQIWNRGIDLGLEGTHTFGGGRDLRWALSLTATHARQEQPASGEQPLPSAPQLYGRARISYAMGGALPTASLAAYAADPSNVYGIIPLFGSVKAPPTVTGVATLWGRIPFIETLSYTLSVIGSVEDEGSESIGPLRRPGTVLMPIDRFRLLFGLRYGITE